MKSGLWEWFGGTLVLDVRGHVAVFLNRVLQSGLELWEVEQLDQERIRCRISMSDFRRLPHPFPGCRIRVVQRAGWPVLTKKLRRRGLFTLGAVSLLIALNIMALFLWQIEIKGAERVHPGQVTRSLQEMGIRPGIPLWRIERDAVKENLQLQFASELNWVNLSLHGSKLVVELIERQEPFESRTGDIFAQESGLITQMHVQQGEALYQTGAMVRQGDPLVLGYQRDSLGRYVSLRAEAQVQARVWRQTEVTVPYQRLWYEETGESQRITWFRLGEQSWPLGDAEIAYQHYRAEVQPTPAFFDFRWLNAEVFDIIYVELLQQSETLSPQQAEQKAEEDASAALVRQMPSYARLQNEQKEILHGDEGVTVRLIWESLEEIGRLVPHY